jgi:hypothetical protein
MTRTLWPKSPATVARWQKLIKDENIQAPG